MLIPAEDPKATLTDSRGPEGEELDSRIHAWRRVPQKPPSEHPMDFAYTHTHTNKLLLWKATEVWGLFVIALGSLPYLIQTNKDKLIKISSHWPISSRL